MKEHAKIALAVVMGFSLSLFASGQQAHAQKNPLLDWDFWQNATIGDVANAMNRGANIHERDNEYGGTALHWAAELSDKPEVVNFLLENGANIHDRQKEYDATPLHLAALNENSDVANLFLNWGADIHDRDNEGHTPLHWAAENDNPKVAELLLIGGANNHARGNDGWVPLHSASAWNKNPEVAKLLLDSGADIHAREKGRWTPLHLAAWKNENPEVAALLLDRGADVLARDNKNWTPLHSAALDNENPAVAALLLDRGSDIHARDWDGGTPLHWAAKSNTNPEVLSLLISRGGDILARDNGNQTPLDLARQNDNADMVGFLSQHLNHGATWRYRERTVANENNPFADKIVISNAQVSKYNEDGSLEGSIAVSCDGAGNPSINVSYNGFEVELADSAIVRWGIDGRKPIEFPIDLPLVSGYQIVGNLTKAITLAGRLAAATRLLASKGADDIVVFDNLHEGERVERVLNNCEQN